LKGHLLLFGEWMYAKHSIHYTRLPDYFIAFDVFDKLEQRFFSKHDRDKLLADSGIPVVPLIAEGTFTKEQILAMIHRQSAFYDGPVEGVYLRLEKGSYLKERAKLVRPDFLPHDDVIHWSKQILVKNIIAW